MATYQNISKELAEALLKKLRPVDRALGIKVLCGSPLQPCPPVEVLIQPKSRLFWLAALTNLAQSQSHSGLYLDGSSLLTDLFDSPEQALIESNLTVIDLLGEGEELCQLFPERVVDAKQLDANPAAYFVYRPECQLIYLQRWYRMETKIGACVRERLQRPSYEFPNGFSQTFQDFFPTASLADNPWQAAACYASLRHDFSVITGGPGTGKTTTVTRLVGLLLSLPEPDRPQSIRMVAPTGKAADRLSESFRTEFEAMRHTLPEAYRQNLSALVELALGKASTIHSFLGSMGPGGFRYNAGNPASCDVLIVDESSMVDLELFIALFDALPPECRIILLGDKNQLAAVGTGNVFTDLTGNTESMHGSLNASTPDFRAGFKSMSGFELSSEGESPALCGDAVVELTKSYRFLKDSQVGRLARLLLSEARLPKADELDLNLVTLAGEWKPLIRRSLDEYKQVMEAGGSVGELLEMIAKIRVLCAVRSGDYGVEAINKLLGTHVLGSGHDFHQPMDGLPFMVRANDKNLDLANGDCGIFRADGSGELNAYLPPAGKESEPRQLNPFALPDWEPAFALTIHKSQGSEYESVVVVLPEMKRNFITWELVYTAITRGKSEVSLVVPESLMGHPLSRVQRRSGLRQELLTGV